jgi:hypothetical protein
MSRLVQPQSGGAAKQDFAEFFSAGILGERRGGRDRDEKRA